MNKSQRYITAIKNPEKRRYASDFYFFLCGDLPEPNSDNYQLGTMAKQAVRMNLNECFAYDNS